MSTSAPPAGTRAPGYDELVREGLALIPAYAPEWTNHNPADPGITLVELLAYFSEILAYRALRLTPDARLNLLRLLEGEEASQPDGRVGLPAATIDEAIRARVQAMSHDDCAVTAADFERLATAAARTRLGGEPILFARCVPATAQSTGTGTGTGDIRLVLGVEPPLTPDGLDALCREVAEALAPRCLLTVRVAVVPAQILEAQVECRLVPRPGVSAAQARAAADAALAARFDPRRDAMSTHSSRLGRPVDLGTIVAAVDRADGVDHVDELRLRRLIPVGTDADHADVGLRIGVVGRVGEDTRLGGIASTARPRLRQDDAGEADVILVEAWEMVRVRLAPDAAAGGRADAG